MIFYSNVSLGCNFTVDKRILLNIASFIIKVSDKFLLGLLNSKLAEFLMSLLALSLRGESSEFKVQCEKGIPINILSPEREILFKSNADQQALKKEDPQANTSALEKEIDLMVYALYGLSEEEIVIVENSQRKP